ncbi:MAG: copper-binding protein [Nitrospinae bacterium]|nr:copper-binding protein [Nitrospinota bacterium]
MKIRALFLFLFLVLLPLFTDSHAGEVLKSKAVVVKVDLQGGKVNLDMEAVPSLKWPRMKMDFDVQNKLFLENLSAGQKVDFDFYEQHKNHWVITKITPAK